MRAAFRSVSGSRNGLLKLTFALVFRNLNGVFSGETSVTETATGSPGQAMGGFNGEVGEGIRADLLCNLLYCAQAAGDQVFPGIHVCTEEAGVAEGRRNKPASGNRK